MHLAAFKFPFSANELWPSFVHLQAAEEATQTKLAAARAEMTAQHEAALQKLLASAQSNSGAAGGSADTALLIAREVDVQMAAARAEAQRAQEVFRAECKAFADAALAADAQRIRCVRV